MLRQTESFRFADSANVTLVMLEYAETYEAHSALINVNTHRQGFSLR